MKPSPKYFKIFITALVATVLVIVAKYALHALGWEPIEQTSLHNSVISSVIFVIGFVLTATIADYKESERIPSKFASTVENMYEDAKEIRKIYTFDLDHFRGSLLDVLDSFRAGTRVNRKGARREISELNVTFGEMEKAGVPANFIVKLKQQQAILLESLYRVNYIQRIKFIPSAFLLVRSIVVLVVAMLLLTDIDPFFGGMMLTGIITFIMTYMVYLIHVISIPFHDKGASRDDVSLFLLQETSAYMKHEAPKSAKKSSRK